VEHPESSLLWRIPELETLMNEFGLFKIAFDQCCFALRPPDFDVNVIDDVNHGVNHDVVHFPGDGEMINGMEGVAGQILENTNQQKDIRVKKPTIFLTNLKGLGASLGRRCDGQHLHSYVIGNVKVQDRWIKRSTAAGVYPAALCRCMAQAVNREC
jgi:hypothetical protein